MRGRRKQAVEMTDYGKHGKTIKPFFHPSHCPWKSLRRLPHFHRHGCCGHEYLPEKPTGGPIQMIERDQIRVARPPVVAGRGAAPAPPPSCSPPAGPASNNDTQRERKKLQQLSGIKVVVDGKK